MGTIKNRLCALRWWTEEVSKEGVVPGDNARLGIPSVGSITNENKAQELGDSLGKVTDGYVRVSLLLERAFGLRREEAIKIIPAYADRGDRIVLKKSWTKGGRARVIPITAPVQRIVLDAAHKRAGNGSLNCSPAPNVCRTASCVRGSMPELARAEEHARAAAWVRARALRGFDRLASTRRASRQSTRELTPLQRMQSGLGSPSTNRRRTRSRAPEISSVYLGR